MSNYIVYPDLYKGSALSDIINSISKDVMKYNVQVKYVTFSGKVKEIPNGNIDNPDVFFTHNIKVLKKLKKTLKNKDKVLFIDFFQPGLGLLKYYLEGNLIVIKFGSLFHGASFIQEDFFKEKFWLKNFELGLLDIMQVIYVPSAYTANFFTNIVSSNRIKVFPFGFDPGEFKCNLNTEKIYDVIIPHRWSWDKNPLLIKEIIEGLPDVKFAISGYGKYSKDDKLRDMFLSLIKKENVINLGIKSGIFHYKDLNNAKIVLATRDSFGYSIRKAIACGCVPLATNSCAYPEFINKNNLFNNVEEAIMKINEFIKIYPHNYQNIKKTEFKDLLKDFFEND
ncbi:MAG: glycosyltransferase [Bacteroidales bacterium]|nr:glycosyltransferase [Bacteroidales bacterium]